MDTVEIPSHLNADAALVLHASYEAKVAFIQSDFWVPTPTANLAFQWMNYLFRCARCMRPECAQIIAPPGMGKSAILKHFADHHPPTPTGEPSRLIRPVLLAEALGDQGGADSIRHALFKGLWPDMKSPGSYCSMDNLDESLRAQGVRLALLDETAEVSRAGPSAQKKALSELKRLGNQLGLSIVSATVVGMDMVLKQDPQLYSRFRRHIRITNWTESQDFRNFLYGCDCHYPFVERSNFDCQANVRWLLQYTDGNTQAILHLLKGGALYALARGHAHVTKADLESARTADGPPPIAPL